MNVQTAQEPGGALKQPPAHIPDKFLKPKFVISMNRELNALEEIKLRECFPDAEIHTFLGIRTSGKWLRTILKVSENNRDVFVVLANPEDFPLCAESIAVHEIPHGRVFERTIKGQDGEEKKVAGMVRIDVRLFKPERILRVRALKILFFVDRKRSMQLDVGRAKEFLRPFMPKELMESTVREKEWKEPTYLDGVDGVIAEALGRGKKPTVIWFERCTKFIEQKQHVIAIADLANIRMAAVAMKLVDPVDDSTPIIPHLTVVGGKLYRIHIAFREL